MRASAQQDRQLLDVGLEHHVAQVDAVVDEHVEQATRRRQAEHLGQRRPRDVGVDQKHRVVELHRDAHREVERGEALALAGQRARDHDQVAVLDRRSALARGIEDQRALDDAEFVGDLRARRIGRDDALRRQGARGRDATRRGSSGACCDGTRRRRGRDAGRAPTRLSPERRLAAWRVADSFTCPARRCARVAGFAGRPGTSTPARRSSSRRLAACSMRLMVWSSQTARVDRSEEREQACAIGAEEGENAGNEADEAAPLAALLRLADDHRYRRPAPAGPSPRAASGSRRTSATSGSRRSSRRCRRRARAAKPPAGTAAMRFGATPAAATRAADRSGGNPRRTRPPCHRRSRRIRAAQTSVS